MSDLSPKVCQTDRQMTKDFGSSLSTKVQVYQVYAKAPESHKRCVSYILRNIRHRREGMNLHYSGLLETASLDGIHSDLSY